MRTLRSISYAVVIIGALNWLLVGLFGVDVIAAITGNSFGEKTWLSSTIYVLIGLAGVALVPTAVTSGGTSRVAPGHS